MRSPAGRCRDPQVPPVVWIEAKTMTDLQFLYETGCAVWSGVALHPDTFCAHLAAITGGDVSGDVALRATDLYLACAAGYGDVVAVEAVERTCIARFRSVLCHIVTPSEIDD